MFFFIGGVQPKTKNLEGHPRICPSCGLYGAYLKRVDHYLSIFFLPVLQVKKGIPFVECRGCGNISSETGQVVYSNRERRTGRSCQHCGKPLE